MPARHSLVWLNAGGWQRAAQAVPAGCRAVLERWQSRDWPAVLRRRQPDTPEDQLCLGLALPPDANGDKGRIPFQALFVDVGRIADPLALRAALPHAPPAWSQALHAFAGDCLHSGIAMRIYGSWAWQILTQQSYLTRTSDIDLLFTPGGAEEFRRGIALLAQHATRLPLDGEVVFADGQAVAWKECWQALQAGGGQQVLVKTRSTVRLASMAELVSTLERA